MTFDPCRPINPFRSMLTPAGTICRRAVMARAWAMFRRDWWVKKFRPRAFARYMRDAWAVARHALVNEARIAAYDAWAAAEIARIDALPISAPAPAEPRPLTAREMAELATDGPVTEALVASFARVAA